ncbi:hypothetical protein FA13DRAFT_728876 [Coprinellus micaceus]|uniref:Uncharacterized protein n=1 Tax=Coprinellus micaceus TaxID=71717 RepID=A0A4Y7TVJ7_COPMI|nr:hypothetical protein FA13DRAFT_728876 [Coprinellus micaceus]
MPTRARSIGLRTPVPFPTSAFNFSFPPYEGIFELPAGTPSSTQRQQQARHSQPGQQPARQTSGSSSSPSLYSSANSPAPSSSVSSGGSGGTANCFDRRLERCRRRRRCSYGGGLRDFGRCGKPCVRRRGSGSGSVDGLHVWGRWIGVWWGGSRRWRRRWACQPNRRPNAAPWFAARGSQRLLRLWGVRGV